MIKGDRYVIPRYVRNWLQLFNIKYKMIDYKIGFIF